MIAKSPYCSSGGVPKPRRNQRDCHRQSNHNRAKKIIIMCECGESLQRPTRGAPVVKPFATPKQPDINVIQSRKLLQSLRRKNRMRRLGRFSGGGLVQFDNLRGKLLATRSARDPRCGASVAWYKTDNSRGNTSAA
jgi:hypothetical protein